MMSKKFLMGYSQQAFYQAFQNNKATVNIV